VLLGFSASDVEPERSTGTGAGCATLDKVSVLSPSNSGNEMSPRACGVSDGVSGWVSGIVNLVIGTSNGIATAAISTIFHTVISTCGSLMRSSFKPSSVTAPRSKE